MRRTASRPLPSGRLGPEVALGFGLLAASLGLNVLGVVAGGLACGLTLLAFASYVFVYTPLKRWTTLNTLVGAVPGALPPVIGWAAARSPLGPEAAALFLIVFLWQVPHFLAIAWIYRDDYARAGLRMLPVADPRGGVTGLYMVAYCLALVPASLLPVLFGGAGPFYLVGAVLLGLTFLASAAGFLHTSSPTRARRVLRASLVYLPALFALLLLDGAASPVALARWF